jgi:hypothetical protein
MLLAEIDRVEKKDFVSSQAHLFGSGRVGQLDSRDERDDISFDR